MISERKKAVLILLACYLLYFLWEYNYNRSPKKYTTGVVTNITTGFKSDSNVEYQFIYLGKVYNSRFGKGDYSAKIGDSFIVEFEEKKPKNSRIILYYPIPDSLNISPPRNGWSEIPTEVEMYRKSRTQIFGLYDRLIKFKADQNKR
ncbi:hypothetical protein ACFOUP_06945 [Belliella kenyensis]|uniref:DUF3592 domain-containing protein n=1 Tax=Belliella kenyensis TaxID=1472724 RepID=A0ABV8EKE1_9BACT|nr:hypothetical protein [Belliella kenyensis]MCH7403898.1 hypothetical protein [Belliella kenyensis]MDN3604910.1 hypothetical protein [Belliella kenyensis]